MAWLATAFYITGIIALGSFFPYTSDFWVAFGEVTLLIVFTCLIVLFVCTQFKLRQTAADEILALTKLVNSFCKNPDFAPTEVEYPKDKYWPEFVQKEIDNTKGKGRLAFTKLYTDVVIYSAIGVSFIFALVLALT